MKEGENRGLMLVTGADGFIGSHLAETLLREGYRVRALVQYNSFGSRGNLEGAKETEDLEIVAGDIRDADFCRTLVKDVDTVFHLAALIGIPYSYIAPDSYVDTNIKGTLNICQASREAGVSRVICTSTSEVYGSALYVPIDERHPRQPQSPYSATKIGADAIAMSFYNSFDLPVTIIRPFNTYGPRQSARAFIPTVITQIAAGRKSIKVGDLRPSRDFNFVSDTVDGFIAAARCEATIGQELNIATGRDYTMAETLDLIKELMGADVEIITDPDRIRPEKSEVTRLCGDATRLRQLTGWAPRHTFKEGLRKTIEWFADPRNTMQYKPDRYNV